MKRIYTLIIVTFMLFPFAANSFAQEDPDSVKVAVLLRVKESKPDNNWSGKGTALCDFENDLLAQISIQDFNLTADQIDSAMLRIFFKTPSAKGDVAFYDMDPNWVDTTITWNTAASLTVADTPFATLTVDEDIDAHYWVNITDYIKTALDKGVDFGWRIKSDGTASATSRTSYHADAVMQPTIFLYEKGATSVNLNKNDRISIYPNPASDYVRINLGEVSQGNVILYNISGSRVLQKQIDSNNMRLDLTSLNSGIYLLRIESEQNLSHATKILVR